MSTSLPKSKKLVSISQAAKVLGVSIDTIRRWDKAGILHSERPNGKDRYFSINELESRKFDQALPISEASKRLGISASTLRRLEARDLVKPKRNKAGERLYDQDSLKNFLNSDYFLRKKQIEDGILEPLKEGIESEEKNIETGIENTKSRILSATVEEDRQKLHGLLQFRKIFYLSGLFLVTTAVLIVIVTTFLFLFFPETAASLLGYQYQKPSLASNSAILASGNGQVLGASTQRPSILGRFLKPFSNVSLNIVKQVNPEAAKKIAPTQQIQDINDVFTTNEKGDIIPKAGIKLPDTSYLQVQTPQQAGQTQQAVPLVGEGGNNITLLQADGTLPGLKVVQANLSAGVVTTPAIADGSVTPVKLSDASRIALSSTNPFNSFKTSACSKDQVLQWNGSSLVCTDTKSLNTNSSFLASCSKDQIPSWDGSKWSCSDNKLPTGVIQLNSCTGSQIPSFNGTSWTCTNMPEFNNPIFIENGNSATSFGIKIKRNNDTGSLGYLIRGQNSAETLDIFAVNSQGLITTASVNSGSLIAGDYSSKILGLTTTNFSSSNISQWANNSGYLTAELDTLAAVTSRGNTSSSGISLTENGNTATSYGLYIKRNTDISSLGYLIRAQNNAADTDLFTVDKSGNLVAGGTISGSNFSGSSSGTNTGDQTITLTGDVTGSGNGSFSSTIADNAVDGTDISLSSEVQGDIMYFNGTDWVRLAGSSGNFLKSSGTAVSWSGVTKSDVGLSSVENTTLSTWAGTSNLNTLASSISSGPTTLSGYGITDGLSNSATSTQDAHFGDIYLKDDTTPSHYLQITDLENLTGAHVLSLSVNNADRTLTIAGDTTISGINTGDQTNISGNAATATAFQTARTINGVSFDGTANITVTAAAGTLTGNTLASGVTASSLTSVGTLGDLTVTNTITGNISGNAGTVTNGVYINATNTLSSASPIVFSNTNPVVTLGAADANGTFTIKDSNGSPHTLFTLTDAGTTGNLTVTGTVGASNFSGTSSGTNTGDQTITLSGDISGSGTSGITTTIGNNKVTGAMIALGSDVTGDIMYYNGTDYVRLAGSAGFLKSTGSSAPSWSSVVFSDIGSTPTTLGGYGITDALSNSTTSTQTGYFGDIKLKDDTNPSHYLAITAGSDLTVDRVLTINTGDAARTVTLNGDTTLSGTNTGDQTNITGNAGTATALQTARTINGTSFDGTANITVTSAAGTLTGTTLASGVTASSLTSVGTLTGLTVTSSTATGNQVTLIDTSLTTGTLQSLSFTNNSAAAAGNTATGLSITENAATNTGNTSNLLSLTAGANGTVNGINISSATGFTKFLETPSIDIDSSGNISGVGTIGSGAITSTGAVTGTNLSGTNTGDQTITLTGDVTGSGTGSFAATIANSAVTLAKIANINNNTILGNNSGSAAAPIALTAAQTKAILAIANTDVSGLGTMSTQNANSVAITGGTLASLTGFAIRDTSAAFDVTFSAASTTTLTAGRTLTLDVKNAARTLTLGGNVTVSADTTLSGTNTGDQTITLTGDVTGSGTGSFATTVADNSVDGTDIALGSDTTGDVMYYDGTDWVRLAGASGCLKSTGAAAPTWGACGGGSQTPWTSDIDADNFSLTDFGTGITARAGLTVATGANGTNALTLNTGNHSSGTAGNVVLDVGTSSSGNGSILIGTAARTQTITIGNSTGGVITIGASSGSGLVLNDAQWSVTDAGAISTTSTLNVDSSSTLNTVTVDANAGLTLSSGTGQFSQTYAQSGSSGGNAQALGFQNTNTANAGTTVGGLDITPTNTAAPLSGTNTLNLITFEAGGALDGSHATNGLKFASATGYTNFLTSPSIVISSAGAITGATYNGLTVTANGTNTLNIGAGLTLGVSTASKTLTGAGTTLTFAGDFTTSGANALTLTTTGVTSVTLPTSGTLVNSAVTTLSSLTTVGSLVSGTVIGSQTFTTNNIADSGALTIATGGTGALIARSANNGAGTSGASTFSTGTGTTGTGLLTLVSGNASAGTAGNIALDVGTSSSGNGSILIGNAARTQTITIGNSTGGIITIGASSGSGLVLNDAQWSVSDAGAAAFASVSEGGTGLSSKYAPINANFVTVTSNATLTGETGIDALTTAISTTATLNVDSSSTLNAVTLDANAGLTMSSGTGVFAQTYSNSTAGNARTLAITNSNSGAGVTIGGLDITPTNTTAPSSGTNILNILSFEAGGALGANDNTHGINFASATGYTNFLKTPTIVITSAGNITGVTASITGAGGLTLTPAAASGLTLGTTGVGNTTSITLATDSTGDAEIVLPGQSVSAGEILNDTITSAQLNATLTFSAADFVDLASIIHNTTANQGLRLPNAASATPSNPTSGEGYLAWDSAGNQLITYNGAAWTTVGGGSCSTCLLQAPTTTAQNTVTPTTASVVGLTVNATSSTAAIAAIFAQSQAADVVNINMTNTAGTITNGLLINRNGTGGTTTNGLNIANTLGTLTTGILMTGTYTNLIDTPTFDVSNAGTVTLAASQSYTGSGAVTLSSGGSSGLTLDSASGRVSIATGDFLSAIVSGVSGATSGDVWYDSAAAKFKINEGGVTKTVCNLTDLGCGAGGAGVSLAPAAAQTDSSANPSIWINDTGGGALLQLSNGSTPVNRFVVANSGGLTISAATSDVVKTTTGTTLATDFSLTGSTLTNVTSSSDLISIDNGAVTNTMSTSTVVTAAAAGAGSHTILRDDGQYIIIHGNSSATASRWDGASATMTSVTVATGAVLPGAGAISLKRPDGRYLLIHGNASAGLTSVFDPYNVTAAVAGPAVCGAGAATTGTNAFLRDDGKYVIICGNLTAWGTYDPTANTYAAGTAVAVAFGAGAHAIRRDDGTFLVFRGANTTTHWIYNPYASATGTMTQDPIVTNAPTINTGAFSIRRSDGKYLVMGGAINTSSIYDPTRTSVNSGAGSMTAQSGAGFGPTAALADGAQALWRQDGKYLLITGTTTTTNVIDPSKTDLNQFLAGPALNAAASAGIHGIMRADGAMQIIRGGATTTTDVYNTGFVIGGSGSGSQLASYETECITSTNLNSTSTLKWTKNAEGRMWFQVKTGTGACSGTYKDILNSGDLINPTAGDNRVQVKVFFQRDFPKFADQEWGLRRGLGQTRYRRTNKDPALYDISVDNSTAFHRTQFEFGNSTDPSGPVFVNLNNDRNRELAIALEYGVGYGSTILNTANLGIAYAGAFTEHTALTTGITGFGTLVVRKPDGKYIIIAGTAAANAMEYDSVLQTVTAQSGAGNIPTAATGKGAAAFKRPDGKFLVILGGNTTTTNIYDPLAASGSRFVAGPAVTAAVDRGSSLIPLPNGRLLIIHGNNLTTTSIYDPFQNTMVAGPVTSAAVGHGGLAIPRPDGTYLVTLGNPAAAGTCATTNTVTNHFSPYTMTFTNNTEAMTATPGEGAFAIQRTDGMWWIFHGAGGGTTCTAASTSSLYNPFTNQIVAGPASSAVIGLGGYAMPRPDGTWLLVHGGNLATTSICKERTGATGADSGVPIGGCIAGPSFGPVNPGTALLVNAGATAFQRDDGKHVTFVGNTASQTTTVRVYDGGWIGNGTYRSEALNIADLDSSSALVWQSNAAPGAISAEVKTATSKDNLQIATSREIPISGGLINPGGSETWINVSFNFRRTFPSYPNVMADVWSNNTNGIYELRKIEKPILNEFKITKDVDLVNLKTDGLSMFRVSSAGDIYTSSTGSINTGGADLAERYTSQVTLEKGELVSIDPQNNHGVKRTNYQYQPDILGVVSTAPGFVAGAYTKDSYPIALIGRVPVKISTENGMIRTGDYLTAASVSGHAMKASVAGRVLGKALENLDSTELTDCPEDGYPNPKRKCGSIMVFVNLTDYMGAPVEMVMAEKQASTASSGVILGSETTPESNTSGFWTSQNEMQVSTPSMLNEQSQEKKILSFLSDLKKSRSDGVKSEVFTDRLAATDSVISPKIVTDILYAKTIKADSIEGLEILTDKVSSLSEKLGGLTNPISSPSATSSGNLAGLVNLSKINASIATISGELIADNLHIKKDSFFDGLVHVLESITTKNFIVTGWARFLSDVIFKGEVNFEGRPNFNKDTAGFAVIRKDVDKVEIIFEKEYTQTPLINTTITLDELVTDKDRALLPPAELESKINDQEAKEKALLSGDIRYVVTKRSTKGFTIKLNKPAMDDIKFSWSALAVLDPKTIQSSVLGVQTTPTPIPSSTPSPTPSPAAPVTQKTVSINETELGYLRVRDGISSSANEIGKVTPGQTFKVLEENSGWYKIEYEPNNFGWIKASYVTIN